MAVLFSLFLSICSFADQTWEAEGEKTLQVKGGLSTPGLDFALTGPGPDATFVPNNPTLPFLALSYRNLGLTLHLPSTPTEDSIREKGRSDIQDYQFRFFGHRTTIEAIYQNFRGYRMDGWEDSDGQNLIRPDVQSRTLRFQVIRALSPRNYSLAVALDQRGVQIQRGGSAFVWGGVGHSVFQADGPFIPSSVTEGRGEFSDLSELHTHSAMVGLGYGYLIPFWKRFYFTLAPFAGFGVALQKTTILEATKREFKLAQRVGLRFGLGYNRGNHLAGLQLIVDENATKVADGRISQSVLNTRLFYGYRIQNTQIKWIDQFL